MTHLKIPMDPSNQLTKSEYDLISDLVVETYQNEILRLIDKNKMNARNSDILYLFGAMRFYSFFHDQSLKMFHDRIYQSEGCLEFVLNFTYRLSSVFTLNGVNNKKLIDTLTEGFSKAQTPLDKSSLFDMNNRDSFFVSKDVVNNIFSTQFEMVALYLLMMNTHKITAIIDAIKVINNNTKDNTS